ncbi:serine hydrolase [Rhodohalobacter sulfatireducens]|uniref:Serine hydrolase n=1 Tax=Rhodohalobacter sulfatireducens TaxID=2911366 RepID=A0ABS9KEX6_9BACT|nr:serine hydrolase [Rhodohalobacter sulfatireducens]MCG2589405.1 serine hydrolase [Rhodohalobacter sulfatireducens]
MKKTKFFCPYLILKETELKVMTVILLSLLLVLPSQVFGQGETPEMNLHMAVLQGNLDIVQQHITSGSDLDQKDAFGSTPLIIATTFGKTDLAKILIEGGANLEITNNEGSSPLIIASLFGRTEIVKSLLNHGANRYYRNNEGSTAYDIVAAPFEEDKPLYDQLATALAPLGLKLDYENIKSSRPKIAEMLRSETEELKNIFYQPLQENDWKVSTPEEQELDPMLIAELYHEASKLETIYSLLVVKDGYLVAEKYFNEGTIDQKARLQSVTKSFTSALVGIALEQGCLESVDQPMMEFFPEIREQISDTRKEEITIRHLLQMRSGFPWEESTQELFDLLYEGFRPSTLVDVALTHDLDTEFQYSNLSSHILGIIVARACETNLKSFALTHLFEPMDIKPGEWIQDWEGYYNGHGDLHLTARDAAKFGLLYLGYGRYKGNQIVPAAWVGNSLQNYSENVNSAGIRNGSVGRYLKNIGYGYQWWSAAVDDYRFNLAWGHGGQFIFLLDEYDMVVVVTSDPFFGQHDDEAWKHERSNINLVGKFIQSLLKSDPLK